MIEIFLVKPYQLLMSFLLDLIIGDPKNLPHPIIFIGKQISYFEKLTRKIHLFSDKVKGILFSLLVCSTTFSLALVLVYLFNRFTYIFWVEVIYLFLMSQFLALKGLIEAGKGVERSLRNGEIVEAREKLKALVGRDTEKLNKKEIERAILESYAENLNDGVIAPVFWLFLLGFPGLVLYKTINTLDSMVGYKNEKYLHFGWFSAKLDDLFNFIPARITAFLIVISAFFILGYQAANRSLKCIWKYASLHPSPNSGYPESALAGALGVRLLGPAYYEGKLVIKPYLGEELIKNLEPALSMSIKIMYFSSIVWVFILFLVLSNY
ncbi:MAG: adenosylcobinamide-phosphate synthase CbiB [Caldimicrobium sp.]